MQISMVLLYSQTLIFSILSWMDCWLRKSSLVLDIVLAGELLTILRRISELSVLVFIMKRKYRKMVIASVSCLSDDYQSVWIKF